MARAFTIKLAVAIAAVLLCCASCAAGSCLSYGHACWGAHGKRSGGQGVLQAREQQDASSGRDLAKSRWFLSKLIQNPVDIRYFLDGVEGRRRNRDVFKKDVNAEGNDKGQNDWERIQNYANDDELFEDSNTNEDLIQDKIFKQPKFLEKRSTEKL